MLAGLQKLRWIAAYRAFQLIIAIGRLVPTRFAYTAAAPVADACFLVFRKHRRNLISNFRRVLKDEEAARRAARASFRHFSRYVIDFFQLPAMGADEVRRRIQFDSWAQLEETAANGKGTIFATLHFGQWEMGAAALAAYGFPVNVIAQTLPYPPLNDLVQGFRRDLGMNIVPAERAKLATFKALARNEFVGMLLDVVEPGEGVVVDFFGGRSEMSGAPARIALRTGARVVPGVMARDPSDPRRLHPLLQHDLDWEPSGDEEEDVRRLTQAMASCFESFVGRMPDQWYGFHEMWPERLNEPAAPIEKKPELWRHWSLLVALKLVGWLPKTPAYGLARVVGDGAYYVRRSMREDVEDNMRHVLGPGASRAEVRRAAREAVRNVCRYYADLIRLPRTSSERLLLDEIKLVGFERLTEAMEKGRGAVAATAHFGNPEMAAQIASLLGLDVLVLSEPLNPPEFSDLVHRLRASNRARYEEVGYGAVSNALRHLREGRTRKGKVVAIAIDRDIQGTGAPVPFFGEVAPMPLGAVELAARTNAAIVPAYCRRRKGGYDLIFEEAVELVDTGRAKEDVLVNARRLLARAEEWIRSDPGQWMVLERVWGPVAPRKLRGKPSLGATIGDTAGI
jgi:lauroyl/myristoyl acyltransferase